MDISSQIFSSNDISMWLIILGLLVILLWWFEFFGSRENFVDRGYDIYVLSLVDAKERRARISQHLGDDFTFFDGVLGKNVDRKLYPNFFGNDGELGCYLGHMNLLKKLSSEKRDRPVLILEDDAVILDNDQLNAQFDRVINSVPDFDMIFFGHRHETKGDHIVDDIYRSVYPMGAYGYLVSPKGIDRLTRLLNAADLIDPIDVAFAKMIQNEQLIAYSVWPQMISYNDLGHSYIEYQGGFRRLYIWWRYVLDHLSALICLLILVIWFSFGSKSSTGFRN